MIFPRALSSWRAKSIRPCPITWWRPSANALNDRQKALKGARILVLGVAYKKDVDDLRESPSLKIMQLLIERGARVDYNDPYFPQLHKMRHYDYANMRSVDLTPANLAGYDCVVIATDHTSLRLSGHRGSGAAGRGYAQRHAADHAQPQQDRAVLAAEAKDRRHSQPDLDAGWHTERASLAIR